METVQSCTLLRNWKNPKDANAKEVPIYSVMLTDGQGGESFGKEIPVGTAVSELVLESGQYGLKIKWNKPVASGGFGGGKRQGGNESFALAYAKDIAVAHIEKGKEFKASDVVTVAETFYNWMESKKK